MHSDISRRIRATHGQLMTELETTIGRLEAAEGTPAFAALSINWLVEDGVLFVGFDGLPAGEAGVLVQLACRTLTERSRRWRDGALLPIDPDWRLRMRDRWPGRYACPIICGDGRSDLLTAMATWLAELPDTVVFEDIKAKYGSLRAYYLGKPIAPAIEIIEAAELLSEMLCEVCGAPAIERPGRWIQTLCDEHAGGQNG